MSAREWGIRSVLATAPPSGDWHVEELSGEDGAGARRRLACVTVSETRPQRPGEMACTSLTLAFPSVKQRWFQEG